MSYLLFLSHIHVLDNNTVLSWILPGAAVLKLISNNGVNSAGPGTSHGFPSWWEQPEALFLISLRIRRKYYPELSLAKGKTMCLQSGFRCEPATQ